MRKSAPSSDFCTTHTPKDHYSSLKFVLSVYDRTIENVVAIIEDSQNMNCAFGHRIRPKLVEWNIHHFMLAIKNIFREYKEIIEKNQSQMKTVILHSVIQVKADNVSAAQDAQ